MYRDSIEAKHDSDSDAGEGLGRLHPVALPSIHFGIDHNTGCAGEISCQIMMICRVVALRPTIDAYTPITVWETRCCAPLLSGYFPCIFVAHDYRRKSRQQPCCKHSAS